MNYSFHEASCYGNLWVKVIWKDGLFLLIKTFGQNLCKSFNLYFLCSFKGLGTMTLIRLPFIAQVASGINFLRFVIRMGGGAEACGHSVAGKLESLSEIARCGWPHHDGKNWFGHSNLSLSVSADAGVFQVFSWPSIANTSDSGLVVFSAEVWVRSLLSAAAGLRDVAEQRPRLCRNLCVCVVVAKSLVIFALKFFWPIGEGGQNQQQISLAANGPRLLHSPWASGNGPLRFLFLSSLLVQCSDCWHSCMVWTKCIRYSKI